MKRTLITGITGQDVWLMLQQEKADDFVFATGRTHTVRRLVEIVFDKVGLKWLLGDPEKARETLGWAPEVNFEGLIEMMIDYDLKKYRGL
ncbi:GDP-mannose 4,6-dehydratase [Peribacillus butanolivorans]|uniref:GDP-mannose 4,6-dehydratase n=1 Tax=Peribacillus butanolivorans TaxID=421767 RepID=UPI00363FB026